MEGKGTNITELHGGGDESGYRGPPVNYEAEQALLAAVLTNNQAFERVADFLRAEHFADPVHARIFEACRKLIDRGQMANAVTLKNHFEQDDALAEAGGAQYLAQLQGAYVTIINAEHYGRAIFDLYLRRQLIAIGEETVNDAFDHDLDLSATHQIEAAEQKLYELGESGLGEGGFQAFNHVLTNAVKAAEAALTRESSLSGVPTGFTDLDEMLGGLHRSDLIILAGRPSMGKTALATNIGFRAARQQRKTEGKDGAIVAFFSLEMSAEQLATRILSEETEIPSERIRRGDLTDKQFDQVVQVSNMLSTMPIYIDDSANLSVAQLRTRARRLKRQQGLGFIIVDYLQLMRPSIGSHPENRVQELSEITRALKGIAKDLDIPVLALSQLSRAVEQRDDKRPQLADLRESGSIEQDADVVMFVYRESYYKSREEPEKGTDRHIEWQEQMDKIYDKADIIIGKQRHGPTGTIRLTFDGQTTKFENYIADDHLPDATA